MKLVKVLISLLVALGITSGAAWAAKYGPGASDKEIKIGHINPYSGPASAYGAIGLTIQAYIKMVNENGGVNGRKINLVTYDDGYSPPKTVEMARKLVEQDKVLFIFQSLGTPTNTAIHRYMNKKKTPHLFVATGASKWDNPKKYPWTMGWQPNYPTEATIYARHIAENLAGAKIGILYQNDDFGKDYLEGFQKGLKKFTKGMKNPPKIVKEQSYEVTNPTVDSQIVNLKNSGADTLVNITTPKFAAQAIKKVAGLGWKPNHYLTNVATSVGAVMIPAGVENGDGIISSQYLMDPTDPMFKDTDEAKKWYAFMAKYQPKASLHSTFNVYGYSVGHTLMQVLEQAGDDLTRANIMKQAASLNKYKAPMLLPGITISTSANDFAPIQQMQLMKFDGKGKDHGWRGFGDVLGAN